MKRRGVIIVMAGACALALAAAAVLQRPDAAPVRVSASIDRPTALVGDSIRYSLTVTTGKGVTVEPPALDGLFAGFIVRDKKVFRRGSGGRKVITYLYVLTKDESGEFAIPALTVRYKSSGDGAWSQAAARGFTVTIKSVAGRAMREGTSTITIGGAAPGGSMGRRPGRDEGGGSSPSRVIDIGTPTLRVKEAAGPKEIPTAQDVLFSVLSGLAGLLVALFAVSFVYGKLAHPPQQVVPPHEVALARLKALKPKEAYAQGRPKHIYAELLSVLKEYVRKRYGMREAEMTAREFLSELDGVKEMPGDEKKRFGELVTLCDLAKYSEYTPPEADGEALVAEAKAIINRTMPKERPVRA